MIAYNVSLVATGLYWFTLGDFFPLLVQDMQSLPHTHMHTLASSFVIGFEMDISVDEQLKASVSQDIVASGL